MWFLRFWWHRENISLSILHPSFYTDHELLYFKLSPVLDRDLNGKYGNWDFWNHTKKKRIVTNFPKKDLKNSKMVKKIHRNHPKKYSKRPSQFMYPNQKNSWLFITRATLFPSVLLVFFWKRRHNHKDLLIFNGNNWGIMGLKIKEINALFLKPFILELHWC